MEEDVKMLLEADPVKQEPLVSEVELDPMAAEQTWPTEEDEEQGMCVSVFVSVYISVQLQLI